MPDRYGVVGYPIHHSKSPLIHGMFAASTGESLTYERYAATPEEFAAWVGDFFAAGGRGLNVTVPHKEAAVALADELAPRALRAGAVNTLTRLADGRIRGDNTDGAGLLADLDRLGIALAGQRLLILGAGGATRGILGPLLDRRPAELCIANRTAERAQLLAAEATPPDATATPPDATATPPDATATPPDATATRGRRTRVFGCGYADLAHGLGFDGGVAPLAFDLILHATPLGLSGQVPEVTPAVIGPDTFAYDLGYGTPDTPFLRWAAARGAKGNAQGIGMLVEQAAEAFLLWRGLRPDTTAVHRALAADGGGSASQTLAATRKESR